MFRLVPYEASSHLISMAHPKGWHRCVDFFYSEARFAMHLRPCRECERCLCCVCNRTGGAKDSDPAQ